MTDKESTKDLREKVESAKGTAFRPDATERDKADLKLLEQEAVGAELRKRHPPKPPATADKGSELDTALEQTFPASDPVSAQVPANGVPAKREGRE